ncbi:MULTISPECIES: gliding motility-associated ABC transporter permease subunit GldF [unclassified Arenibacter]|jgi:ABC-2 type transport system permease protein|uniref:gliding motility-associated ABC transporter permease subunit GldF n=1 Tax=unclassified Arenibacter TaxID=2615047 RepID=UPI000E349675|nr:MULTISPECIES: gliding motility-associated ABC transporter permease subunit GldF [unclassified Arenibacter]MCM4165578.1 gliding motility-associated ABC transporter permease subunit GldF [Arenibacter sp. A80]RFT54730.1 gliding motility-associated ABC transporter permease subunit GldF [Arenibacter sp. P308M17]
MIAIFKREIQSFFTSPIGYLVIGLFLVLTGLFLWVFKGPFNIFEYGFADLGNFFLLAPWVFLFLIPAITMKSFSEEKKLGTLELLFIKPISLWETVLGKFFGSLCLALIAILPTLLYVYTISQLGATIGNLDIGLVLGSYFSLLFLIASYTAIGLFTSTLSENQIVAFIIGMVLCFFMLYGFESLATILPNGPVVLLVEQIGMKAHFESIARGVLDTRDIIYFTSLTLFFLYLTVNQLKNQNR